MHGSKGNVQAITIFMEGQAHIIRVQVEQWSIEVKSMKIPKSEINNVKLKGKEWNLKWT